MMPQHSFGASSRAWATICSTRARGSALTAAGGAIRREGGGLAVLLVLVVGGDAADGVLELAQALAERLARLGQSLGPEDDEGDHQDDDEFHGANAHAGHIPIPSRGVHHQTVESRFSISSTGRV